MALADLSDSEVLTRVREAAHNERAAIVRLIALLMELDVRRLYLGEGCSSLFTYCTQVLHLSEHAAYNRIETARAARRFPEILGLVESAAVTLTIVRLLAPHVTEANHRDVLERTPQEQTRGRAAGRDAPSEPGRPVDGAQVADAATGCLRGRRSRAGGEGRVAADAGECGAGASSRGGQADSARALQDSVHCQPRYVRKTSQGAGPAAAHAAEHVPASVKRQVWERDGGRCAFNGGEGRCRETGFLEYHHLVPFAAGGETTAGNLELRCRAHNQHEADLWFGITQQRNAREERAAFGG